VPADARWRKQRCPPKCLSAAPQASALQAAERASFTTLKPPFPKSPAGLRCSLWQMRMPVFLAAASISTSTSKHKAGRPTCKQPPPGQAVVPGARRLVHRRHGFQVGLGVQVFLLHQPHNIQALSPASKLQRVTEPPLGWGSCIMAAAGKASRRAAAVPPQCGN
jgi:hypothetical protein